MWYEIIPSFAIVIGALHLPHVLGYVVNYVFYGNGYSRELKSKDDILHFLRDMRISGNNNAYNQKNVLDCWEPEPEPEPKKCECP